MKTGQDFLFFQSSQTLPDWDGGLLALLDGNTLKAEAAMKTANGILPVSTPMKK